MFCLLLLWECSVTHSIDLQPEAAYSAQCEKKRMRKDRQEEWSSWHFLPPICLSMSAASSGVALGRTPGSLKLARSSIPITKTNSTPPMAGMAGVRFDARNGQLEKREWKTGCEGHVVLLVNPTSSKYMRYEGEATNICSWSCKTLFNYPVAKTKAFTAMT